MSCITFAREAGHSSIWMADSQAETNWERMGHLKQNSDKYESNFLIANMFSGKAALRDKKVGCYATEKEKENFRYETWRKRRWELF